MLSSINRILLVPAPRREGCKRSEQTHDYAGGIRNEQSEWSMVPAPMREETTGIAQPLDSAGSTIQSDAIGVVPAPRLELGTPWCLLRRLDISNYSQVLYQLS